jgi:hypothetical protein
MSNANMLIAVVAITAIVLFALYRRSHVRVVVRLSPFTFRFEAKDGNTD